MAGWLIGQAVMPVYGADYWTFGSLTDSLGHTNRIGGQDRTSPAIGIDGSVYVFGDDYRLRAVTPGLTNGVFKWRSDTTNSTASYGAEGSPSVASDGTVWMVSRPFPGGGGTDVTTIYALDPADGTKKGSYNVGQAQTTIGSLASDLNDWTFTSFHERVVAVGANTNGTAYELKWDHYIGGNDHHKIATMPAISTHSVETSGGNTWTNQYIYWAELLDPYLSGSNRVFAMHQKQYTDGTWTNNQAWVWSFPGGKNEKPVGHLALKSDNTVYVLAENTVASPNTQRIYALNGSTGAQLWYTNLGFSPKSAPVIDQDGMIYVGGGDGLYRIDPDTYATTKLLGTSAAIDNAPVIGIDGGIYYTYNTGTAYLAYTNTFTTNSWSLSFGSYSTKRGSPVMDRKGRVYAVLSHVTDITKGQLLSVEGAGRPALSDWPMWGRGYSRNNRAGRTWRAIDLGTLGGVGSDARGVNQDNLVVGLAKNSGGYTKAARAPVTSWLDLYSSVNANMAAYGVNDGGHIVGYRSDTSPYKGFRWKSDSDKQDLNGLTNRNTYALAINNDRRIVGWSLNSYPTFRGVFWEGGSSTPTDIESLNGGGNQYASIAYAVASSGRIAGGSVDDSGYWRAFLTDEDGVINSLTDNLGTLGGNNSYAFGINDAHAVVGQSQINESGWTAGHPRAFYLPYDGTMLEMGVLTDAVASAAYDINNNGLIVGRSQFSGGWYNYRAWVGVAGFTGLVNLNDVTDLNGIPHLTDAYSANDRDVIAGVMMYDAGTPELRGVLLLPNE